ncbi:unnamed protein product [Trichogramma brassicae]|uniref:Uncharacterized protein n=1 Tax=Trichogramma brassicae TaxID=86971 RepID=A0A6H5ICZ3_9HYME|nr:unnamed protein product [Trichogramma brassicae]
MAALDTENGPSRQENHPKDDPHEQSHERARAPGAQQQEPTSQRPRHRRRFSSHKWPNDRLLDQQHEGGVLSVRHANDSAAGHGRGDVRLAAAERYAARAPHDPQGAAVHHEPHEKVRHRVRGHKRLEVCRHGRRQSDDHRRAASNCQRQRQQQQQQSGLCCEQNVYRMNYNHNSFINYDYQEINCRFQRLRLKVAKKENRIRCSSRRLSQIAHSIPLLRITSILTFLSLNKFIFIIRQDGATHREIRMQVPFYHATISLIIDKLSAREPLCSAMHARVYYATHKTFDDNVKRTSSQRNAFSLLVHRTCWIALVDTSDNRSTGCVRVNPCKTTFGRVGKFETARARRCVSLGDTHCHVNLTRDVGETLILRPNVSEYLYPRVQNPAAIELQNFRSEVRVVCPSGEELTAHGLPLGLGTAYLRCSGNDTFAIAGQQLPMKFEEIGCTKASMPLARFRRVNCPPGMRCIQTGYQLNVFNFLPIMDVVYDPEAKTPIWSHTKIVAAVHSQQTSMN